MRSELVTESGEASRVSAALARFSAIREGKGLGAATVALVRELASMSRDEVKRVASTLPEEVVGHSDCRALREAMDPIQRVELVIRLAEVGKLDDRVARETAEFVASFEPGVEPRKTFWNWAIRTDMVKGVLWDVAPRHLQRRYPRPTLTPKKTHQASQMARHRRKTPDTIALTSWPPAPTPTTWPPSRGDRRKRSNNAKAPHTALREPSPPSAAERWKSIDWVAELSSKPLEQVVQEALGIARQFSPFASLIGDMDWRRVPPEVIFHETAKPLRERFAEEGVYEALAMLPQPTRGHLEEVVEHFSQAAKRSPLEAASAWEDILQSSPHSEQLQAMESVDIARARIRRRYDAFFTAYEAIGKTAWELERKVTFRLEYAYGSLLTEDDVQLARLWVTEAGNEYQQAQMLSARAAEKVVMQFYRQFGCQVLDVSGQQLGADLAGADWLTHDLLVDGKPVDVKNTRPKDSYTDGRTGYAEHVVKRFKQDRSNQHVTIVGVRSPFLQSK